MTLDVKSPAKPVQFAVGQAGQIVVMLDDGTFWIRSDLSPWQLYLSPIPGTRAGLDSPSPSTVVR